MLLVSTWTPTETFLIKNRHYLRHESLDYHLVLVCFCDFHLHFIHYVNAIRSLCIHLTLFAKNNRFANYSAIKTKELIFRSFVISSGLENKLGLFLIALSLGTRISDCTGRILSVSCQYLSLS